VGRDSCIRPIGDGLQSQARRFADDCLLYKKIETIEDCTVLQDDLELLKTWADTWKMEFNVAKCFILSITLAKKHKIVNNYTMGGETLTITSNTKYLGVTISSDLKWNTHIDIITAKATRVLNFIKRNLKRCPEKIKEKAYLTYVRPQTEYCTTIWDPNTKENIDKVEKVQKRAARFTKNNYEQQASPTKMIKELKWPPLKQRRQDTSLIIYYQIVHRFIAIPSTILPSFSSHTHGTRYSHSQQLLIPQCRINAYKFSFIPRTTVAWNILPVTVIQSTTTESFKIQLQATHTI